MASAGEGWPHSGSLRLLCSRKGGGLPSVRERFIARANLRDETVIEDHDQIGLLLQTSVADDYVEVLRRDDEHDRQWAA